MLKPIWIVAFSGHRFNGTMDAAPAGSLSCADQIRLRLQEFLRRAEALDGSIELLTSADEEDQIAIEVAESLGLSIHIILPLPIAEFAKIFQSKPVSWDLALAAIAKAGGLIDRDERAVSEWCELGVRKVRTFDWPPAPKPGWTFRVADGTHELEDCCYDCSAQMLEAADALIVVVNQGQECDTDSTLDAIDQARVRCIPTALINSNDSQPTEIEWHGKYWSSDTIMNEMAPATRNSKQTIPSSESIESFFATLDEVANRTGGRLKNRVMMVIALQFSATILAVINSALLLPIAANDFQQIEFTWVAFVIKYQVLFAIEFVFVVSAFYIGLSSRWTNLNYKWRQTRFAAEILRGLIHTRHLVDPLYPVVSRHDPIWHRFALSSGLTTLRDEIVAAKDWDAIKTNYHRQRMVHQYEAYYRKNLARASILSGLFGKIATWAGTIAPICVILAMYLKFMHKEWIANSDWSPVWIRFLPILLPLLAGTASSLKVVTDAGRRADRYKTQANRLQALGDLFPILKTRSSILRTAVLTEEILVGELIEWHFASKNIVK